jgi:hypothetical protein
LNPLTPDNFSINCLIGLKIDIFWTRFGEIGICSVKMESSCHHVDSGLFSFCKMRYITLS